MMARAVLLLAVVVVLSACGASLSSEDRALLEAAKSTSSTSGGPDTASASLLDTDLLEVEIKSWLRESEVIERRGGVDCPDDVPIEADYSFFCTASNTAVGTVTVLVDVLNSRGDVVWELLEADFARLQDELVQTLDTSRLERELRTWLIDNFKSSCRDFGNCAGVMITSCPTDVPIEAGRRFICEVDSTTVSSVVVTVLNDRGDVEWEAKF